LQNKGRLFFFMEDKGKNKERKNERKEMAVEKGGRT
jgi:hypothetical protein